MKPSSSTADADAPHGWRRWLPRRLDHQLMLLTAICLLASNLGFGVYTAQRQTALARATLNAQMAALAQNLAAVSTNLLLTDDLAGIESITMQVAIVPGIVGLMVTDASGKPFSEVVLSSDRWSPRFHAGKPNVPVRVAALTRVEGDDDAPSTPTSASASSTGTLAAWHPVLAASHLGWVRVSYRTDHLDRAATLIWLQSLALVVLVISLSLGVLWLSLRRMVRTLRATALFASGLGHTMGARLEVGTSTIEIEALGHALNTLSARLYTQHTDLANQKFALDQHAIVSISDLQGTIRYVNQRFCDISGYSQAELFGQHLGIVSSGCHEPAFFEELLHTINNGQVWRGQICNRHKGGGLYWVDATLVPLRGVDGLVETYIAIRTDITASKQAEAEV